MAIVRGATVFFSDISFITEGGSTQAVDSATLVLSYPLGNSFEEATVTLTEEDDSEWSGTWDSGVSDVGVVHAHLEGIYGENVYAKDFSFKLTANRANERDDE